ncbi:hypothetical protein LCGC14_0095040 [marine sediment metagenome]|uniref:Uncharacterized protein n=1 Tax=marine sediment metagenome TaxID=412755 RepID=A0A0F9XW20_9ZZZZ|nr:hypothetical protein [Phycisphaerae bacterium]
MSEGNDTAGALPPAAQVFRAVEIYLAIAYPDGPPDSASTFRPPPGINLAAWLMSDVAERSPDDEAPLGKVRSFALRIGNTLYPNMKLRISHPPNGAPVFHVDAHDAMLKAPEGSADYEALQQLKAHNASLAAEITLRWEAAGLPTERTYLRDAIEAQRRRGD